jgi:hypothetical protein
MWEFGLALVLIKVTNHLPNFGKWKSLRRRTLTYVLNSEDTSVVKNWKWTEPKIFLNNKTKYTVEVNIARVASQTNSESRNLEGNLTKDKP